MHEWEAWGGWGRDVLDGQSSPWRILTLRPENGVGWAGVHTLPGGGWGGAVPLSFPSAEEAPAPNGLRSWSSGEGGGAEPHSYKTPLPPQEA